MRASLVGFVVFGLVVVSCAQSCFDGWWDTESYEVTIDDPERWYRTTFKAIVHYPSNAPKGCQFPMVIFSHSYMLGAGCYDYIWINLVPLGVVFVDMDDLSYSPLEEPIEAGNDMAATRNQLLHQSANDPSSPIYGMLNGVVGAMGHSFGGAAAIYATSSKSALETYGSNWASVLPMAPPDFTAVIDNAVITLPTLMMGGTKDCICPPEHHVNKIYNISTSDCKTLIQIVNGTHCKFCDIPPIFFDACTVVEDMSLTCGSILFGDTIDLELQQSLVLRYSIPFLQYTLQGKEEAAQALLSRVQADTLSGAILSDHYTPGCV